MLIPFHNIVNKYGLPRGIIHIGAHLLEEREDYLKHGLINTIWVEANYELYQIIANQVSLYEMVFNYAISDISDQIVTLNCTNNSQSSSILQLGAHKKYYPNITVSRTQNIKTQRMDDLILQHQIPINLYNFINLDIQGVELRALRGFGKILENIDFIYTEINREYLYENCDLITDIDRYLESFSFMRSETVWTDSNWGDALYVKKT